MPLKELKKTLKFNTWKPAPNVMGKVAVAFKLAQPVKGTAVFANVKASSLWKQPAPPVMAQAKRFKSLVGIVMEQDE